MREKLKNIVESTESLGGRIFSIIIQLLIITSIVSFSIETIPDLQPQTRTVLKWIEIFSVVVFTAEYLLRIYVADRKSGFIFSFLGIVDLLAILPFYLSFGIDLRSIRALRLIRLFRLLKLVRYNNVISRFSKALRYAKEELILFFFITIVLIYLSAVGIYYFENGVQPENFSSVFDSLWWAVATLTTVGYGDIYPITAGGKVFTFFILLLGLGIVAVPAGIISSALTKAIDDERDNKYS
ncbi:ion transporter [Leptobacterium flavescens]|uniref:Ion transporter n=1 Tax=Leptobacterium flavescens TaxID=472055 RepID=A0A6P0URI2_9FLAO|nr:ion transporter [Leptobacterium flavescens]NER15140.1 ion transporter [Leptobacterium flavescens]